MNHAAVAERSIRTIKDQIYKRVENTGESWNDLLYQVILTQNKKNIDSSTKMTPDDARKKTNELNVKEEKLANILRLKLENMLRLIRRKQL